MIARIELGQSTYYGSKLVNKISYSQLFININLVS